jgi:DDE superfamily endonuclease
MGLAVWCTDQAGPYQTIPDPGRSWRPEGEPARQPHESLRGGTAKALTLFRPADGRARVKGVTACPDAVLRPWLRRELADVLAAMPDPPGEPPAGWRAARERWQEGLTIEPTLVSESPPLRMLLALDNLAGHKTPEFVCWLFAHGVMPLYTPVGGSWRNMAESPQRILKRRALDGRYPTDTAQIIARYEAARHRDEAPTPFAWGGKRAARRQRQRERRHRLGGSGACSLAPVARRDGLWPQASQVTH